MIQRYRDEPSGSPTAGPDKATGDPARFPVTPALTAKPPEDRAS